MRHVGQKNQHLRWLCRDEAIETLGELRGDVLDRNMRNLRQRGYSVRTANWRRQIAITFAEWCVSREYLDANPLKRVRRVREDESAPSRQRRALTPSELASLFRVARDRGRLAWYACAYYAGLRRGDLRRLSWGDVDWEMEQLTIRGGQSRRVDRVPLHPELGRILANHRPLDALCGDSVFPRSVTDRTRRRDFERAGIELIDERGRHADLHALRTTLATDLARAGVPAQVAQRIMRHADYATTQAHYERLGMDDLRASIEAVSVGVGQETGAKQMYIGRDRQPQDDCWQCGAHIGRVGLCDACADDADLQAMHRFLGGGSAELAELEGEKREGRQPHE